jgi:hypothetical protein
MNKPALEKIALSVRSLSMDAIQKANSGHPGLPLGAAELGAWLYAEGLRHDPSAPDWLDRDRFVLSAGHGSMFLYSLLHLAGYAVSLDDIRAFRQLHKPCAGHPEYGMLPGIELTAKTALVPILNLSLVCKEMLSGVWHWPYIALIFGSTTVYAGVALAACVWMFNREDVIFRA